MNSKVITRTVFLLSLVSFFGDIASELLYPILPLYLRNIGMGVLAIGILEGLADVTAGISKTYFGKLSDVSGRRLPFVWFGYLLSSIAKPALGLFMNPVWVFFVRSADRLGKGVRTAARDAMLSAEATSKTKGAVFGFHRSLDTLGAFLGPVLALIFLHFYPGEYRKLFLYALIPSVFVLFSLMFVKEKPGPKKHESGNLFWSSLNYWKIATPEYKRVVSAILLFTLMNSSDMFLLMKARESGMNDTETISLYIFYNLIYAISSYQMGRLSDFFGKKKVFLIGLVFFIITYAGMAVSHTSLVFYILFFSYGLFAAATEGISKAWVSNLCEHEDLATALGFQSTTQSLAAMTASFVAGGLWMTFGAPVVFLFSASGAAVVLLLIGKEKTIR